jgi:hypothetical protein
MIAIIETIYETDTCKCPFLQSTPLTERQMVKPSRSLPRGWGKEGGGGIGDT